MKKLKYILLVFLLLSLTGFAQQKVLTRNVDKQGVINHMVFDNTKTFIPQENAKKLLRDTLKLLKEDEFVLFKESKDELGFTRQIYQQQHKGIKIEDGLFGVHGRNGKIEYISGEHKRVKNITTTPVLSEKNALEKALGYINATKYRWQIPFEESDIKRYKKDLTATFYPKGELLICKDAINTNSIYRLAYKFDIFAIAPLSHKIYYIDAITGDLLDERNLIFDANTPAIGTTLYRGPVPIITDSITGGGGYRLYETRSANNVEIETFNAKNNTWAYDSNGKLIPSGFSEFTNPTTTWPSNAAIDAHWGAERVYDYWLSSPRNRNSLNALGMAIHGYVHYGQNIDNAFWDGNEMVYGDGDSIFNTVVPLDVIAHETGHGITQYSAQLNTNAPGETESINEGLSDIWGAVIENWVVPDNTNNWLIGEQIMKNGKLCLRSLKSPKTEGFNTFTNTYPGGFPNTYKGTYWIDPAGSYPSNSNDQCYCHTNMTVLTHWFYLLSQGGDSINDLQNHYIVYGLGINNAAKIVWKAEKDLLQAHPNAQYSDVMVQTIRAAKDIYTDNSFEVKQVINAWYAVGVGNQYQFPALSGPTLACPGEDMIFTINNLPDGATIVWSQDSTYVTRVSPQGSNPCTFTCADLYSIPISAKVTFGGSSTILTQVVTMGRGYYNPNDFSIKVYQTSTGHIVNMDGPECLCENQTYDIVAVNNGSTQVSNYNWSMPAYWTVNSSSDNTIQINTGSNTEGNVAVSTTNPCGYEETLSEAYLYQGTCDGTGFLYSLSPNPASNAVTISITPAATTTSTSTLAASSVSASYSVKVVDSYSSVVYTGTKVGKQFTIPTASLHNGVYTIIVSDGTKSYQRKLMVKH